jgi:hypothetical protein
MRTLSSVDGVLKSVDVIDGQVAQLVDRGVVQQREQPHERLMGVGSVLDVQRRNSRRCSYTGILTGWNIAPHNA